VNQLGLGAGRQYQRARASPLPSAPLPEGRKLIQLLLGVTDASGQLYRLVSPIRFTVKENTLDDFAIDVHVAKIQLIPIGLDHVRGRLP
jgi:hypothetical protein